MLYVFKFMSHNAIILIVLIDLIYQMLMPLSNNKSMWLLRK